MPKGKNPRGKKNGHGRKGKDTFSRRQREVESVDMESSKKLGDSCLRERDNYHTGKSNDWRWYAQSPQLVKDYASYPFGTPVGNVLRTGVDSLDQSSIPGVMSFNFVPTIGWADSEVSPINVAMRRLYSYVRHANSGASNYDAPDLMLYMICVDSALMLHEHMKRMLGIVKDYTPYNRFYPRALAAAMGVQYDDLVMHTADFRGFVNQYGLRLSQLWIPNSMSYMARHSWMCQGVYTDSNTEKAQTYLYVPHGFYQFGYDDEGAGMAKMVTPPWVTTIDVYPGMAATIEQIENFANSLLAPMISNEDFGIMSGDILKAFGNSGIVVPTQIAEDYQILPVYNEEVLSQMENATILGVENPLQSYSTIKPNLDITQQTAVGTGWLMAKPTLYYISEKLATKGQIDGNAGQLAAAWMQPHTMRKLLNFHHSAVTPEEVMVATRLTNMVKPATTSSAPALQTFAFTFEVPTAGSEIVTSSHVFYFTNNASVPGTLVRNNFDPNIVVPSSNGDVGVWRNAIEMVGYLSNFDWHPAAYLRECRVVDGTGLVSASLTPLWSIIEDVDFYTMLDQHNLENMTTAALLSMFTIPQI